MRGNKKGKAGLQRIPEWEAERLAEAPGRVGRSGEGKNDGGGREDIDSCKYEHQLISLN